jgi:hypothetical protein
MEFEQGAQIVDPCCGEAEAVSVFKDSGRLYGVELDVIRAKKARAKVDVLLNADAINGVMRSLEWVSLLIASALSKTSTFALAFFARITSNSTP